MYTSSGNGSYSLARRAMVRSNRLRATMSEEENTREPTCDCSEPSGQYSDWQRVSPLSAQNGGMDSAAEHEGQHEHDGLAVTPVISATSDMLAVLCGRPCSGGASLVMQHVETDGDGAEGAADAGPSE